MFIYALCVLLYFILPFRFIIENCFTTRFEEQTRVDDHPTYEARKDDFYENYELMNPMTRDKALKQRKEMMYARGDERLETEEKRQEAVNKF